MSRSLSLVAAALFALAACGDDGGDGDPQSDAASVADGSTIADAPGGGDASGNATYRALGIVSALDRVAIVKADPDADVCAVIRLASPGGPSGIGITAPMNWGVDLAGVSQGSANCPAQPGFPMADVAAVSGTGNVSFTIPSGQFFPETVTIDASITFDGSAPAWVPSTIAFSATDIAVE